MRTEVKVEAYMLKVPAPKGSAKKTLDVERFRIVEVPTGRIIEAGIMNRQDAMSRALRKAARTDAKYTAKIRRRDVRKRVVRNIDGSGYTMEEALSLRGVLSREEHAAFDAYPQAIASAESRIDAHTPAFLRSMSAPRSSTWGAR